MENEKEKSSVDKEDPICIVSSDDEEQKDNSPLNLSTPNPLAAAAAAIYASRINKDYDRYREYKDTIYSRLATLSALHSYG